MPDRRVFTYQPTDPRLGRHVVHDPRSRAFSLADHAPAQLPAEPIRWARVGPVFNQDIGCCTACAALGLMMTTPFATSTVYTLADAHDFYSAETRLDGIRGVYPPDDTGSSGLAAMKVLKRRGQIRSYFHAFSARAAVAALAQGPIAVGTVWFSSMWEPKRGRLIVDPRSGEEGGHEYVIDGWDPVARQVHMTNSWSESWGADGGATIALDDFGYLLSQQGDAVQPVI